MIRYYCYAVEVEDTKDAALAADAGMLTAAMLLDTTPGVVAVHPPIVLKDYVDMIRYKNRVEELDDPRFNKPAPNPNHPFPCNNGNCGQCAAEEARRDEARAAAEAPEPNGGAEPGRTSPDA